MRASVSLPTGRNSRGWRPYAAGAAVVAALLTSTACQGSDDGSDQGKGSGGPSATSSATPGATTSTPPSQAASPSAGTPTESAPPEPGATKDGNGNGGGRTAIPTCTQEHLSVTSELEPPDSKQPRHLLLTVQNVSEKKCNLFRYPRVRIGADSQADTPVIKHTDPDPGKPVILDPGHEGYAALLVSGGARDEYEATSITISLQGAKIGTYAGSPIDVPMPVAKLYADDGQLVTYWTTASGFALRAIMSR